MRLRTINAPSMAQAMELVRREFGDDAIIVSTEENDTGIKVVVALEELEDDYPAHGAVEGDSFAREDGRDPVDAVHEALLLHGLPNQLLERLVDASFIVGADDPKEALIGALRQVFDFYPLSERRFNQPVILMGAPGSGKTVTVAKLAARAVFSQRKVRVITTDTVRAGGIEQLDAFARLMKIPLHTAETDRQLTQVIQAAAPDEVVLVDTPGINPYSARDLGELAALFKAAPMEAIMVMAAGGDVVDSMEQSKQFAQLGCTRMIATRLDMVQRLGGILAAAYAGRLPFCDCSVTPAVHDGLIQLDPSKLASLLMPESSPALNAKSATQGLRQ
jgi:flagellar biosynthesis protein FlhF